MEKKPVGWIQRGIHCVLIAGGGRHQVMSQLFTLCLIFQLYALISLCVPDSHATGQGESLGIRCNIWSRAMTRRHIVHSLEGGGESGTGYDALRHESILHGDAGRLGVYPILAFLPDKVCRFLYEFHAFRFESLELPPVPDDGDEVHRILRPDQLNTLLRRIKLSVSQQHTGHFRLFNVLVIGHTKHSGVQRVYCEPFPNRKYHQCHRQDLVFCRPPGMQRGNFILSADSVFYCRMLLLFSMAVATDTGDKTFDCALVSVLENYSGPLDSGNY